MTTVSGSPPVITEREESGESRRTAKPGQERSRPLATTFGRLLDLAEAGEILVPALSCARDASVRAIAGLFLHDGRINRPRRRRRSEWENNHVGRMFPDWSGGRTSSDSRRSGDQISKILLAHVPGGFHGARTTGADAPWRSGHLSFTWSISIEEDMHLAALFSAGRLQLRIVAASELRSGRSRRRVPASSEASRAAASQSASLPSGQPSAAPSVPVSRHGDQHDLDAIRHLRRGKAATCARQERAAEKAPHPVGETAPPAVPDVHFQCLPARDSFAISTTIAVNHP